MKTNIPPLADLTHSHPSLGAQSGTCTDIWLLARENNSRALLLCTGTGTSAELSPALRQWNWCLGTCLDPLDRKKTFTPASDEPHKNGSFSD